jgi:hypothetical protein
MIRSSYTEVLVAIRRAYALVQAGALTRPVWRYEGASSYTVHEKELEHAAKKHVHTEG